MPIDGHVDERIAPAGPEPGGVSDLAQVRGSFAMRVALGRAKLRRAALRERMLE